MVEGLRAEEVASDFLQAANKFVHRTNFIALEGLNEDGSGELIAGASEEVKNAIIRLFQQSSPPRMIDAHQQRVSCQSALSSRKYRDDSNFFQNKDVNSSLNNQSLVSLLRPSFEFVARKVLPLCTQEVLDRYHR